MGKKKKNDDKTIIILIIVLLILVIVVGVVLAVTKKKTKSEEVNTVATSTTEDDEPELSQEDEIKTLSESNRMKRYVGIFFENIENGNYIDAYEKLNQDFRDTYFPRLEDFQEYADKTFNSQLLGVTYDNIERLGNTKTGNMYVLWLTLGSVYQRKLADDEQIEQTKFVIVEYDYNNYEMSFSVNKE